MKVAINLGSQARYDQRKHVYNIIVRDEEGRVTLLFASLEQAKVPFQLRSIPPLAPDLNSSHCSCY